jgi:broad specificity phosphatase PhoE
MAKQNSSAFATSQRHSISSRQHRVQDPAPISARDVLVIDNRPLRERHYQEAQKVILKIERLEEKIRLFHSSDQKRFDEWYELTFRKLRQVQEDERNKYQELARFHNWIVATAHKLDLEMHQAYTLMRDEQLRWNAGTLEERRQIDLERQRREAYIRQEFRTRYNEDFSFEEESFEDESSEGGIEGLEQVLHRLEAMVLEPDFEEELSAHKRIQRLCRLSDERLILAMDDQEVAFMMFDVSLNWGQAREDYDFFKRLWHLMTAAQRKFFAYVYNSVTDEAIEGFLQDIGLSPDFLNDDQDRQAEEDEDDEDDQAFAFDDYVNESSSRSRNHKAFQTARTTVVNDEKLKQTFRKLMRKLHPDVHSADSKEGETPLWVQRIWGLVQAAYSARNAASLERLLKLTLLRMNVLDELTVGEIAEARHWLKQDLEALEEESSSLRTSLAWGFTQKKNFTSLTQKIVRQLEGELREIQEQVEELESQHQLLALLSERPQRSRRRQNTSDRRGRRHRSPRQQRFDFED